MRATIYLIGTKAKVITEDGSSHSFRDLIVAIEFVNSKRLTVTADTNLPKFSKKELIHH